MPLAQTAENLAGTSIPSKTGRGWTIYNFSQLQSMYGTAKHGGNVNVQVERPYFELSVEERLDIFRKCDMVMGVVTSRMNRISSTPWVIMAKKANADKIEYRLKTLAQLWREYSPRPELPYKVTASIMLRKLSVDLPDLLPDMSNFDSVMLRWKKRIESNRMNKTQEITEWLKEPNINDDWEDYVKKYVFDLMVHGAQATYKEIVEGKLANFYVLPGGSIQPIKGRYVGSSVEGYVQITSNMEVQVMFGDEVSFTNYIPSSARAYGYLPLEALVNKVAESLLFDVLMAGQADGTRPPEKMVVFGEKSPFGNNEESMDVPLDADEQKRIETMLNEPRKSAVRTLTGQGTPVVLDLTRENTMQIQGERQKVLRESVALVFNMSNMEVNLSGSDATSGRSTSEEQGEIDYTKGVFPLMSMIARTINTDILPYRYGTDYELEWKSGANEMKEYQKQKLMLEVGYSVNEVREARGQHKISQPQFDLPGANNTPQPVPGEPV